MTDDIVTRLRGQACPECGLPSTHNQFDEAADEIERLRSLVYIAEIDRDYYHERMDQAEKCIEFMRNKKWWKK